MNKETANTPGGGFHTSLSFICLTPPQFHLQGTLDFWTLPWGCGAPCPVAFLPLPLAGI